MSEWFEKEFQIILENYNSFNQIERLEFLIVVVARSGRSLPKSKQIIDDS